MTARLAVGRSAIVAVAVAYVGLVVAVPLGRLVYDALAPGLGPFASALSTRYFVAALANTATVVAASLAITTPMGVLTALVLVRGQIRGRALLDGLVDLPFAAPAAIGALALTLAYGPRGLLGPLLEAGGVRILFALPGMILATVFVTLPFVVREVAPLLEAMGRETVEAARTLGASRWQTFRLVTLPSVREGVLYGVAQAYARGLGEFGAVLAVSGNIRGRTQTVPLHLYDRYVNFETEAAYAAALVLVAASIGGTAGLSLWRRRWRT